MPKVVDHDLRREQLAASACEAIAEWGLDKVKLVKVARSAGFTTGALTHYFPDKASLLLAAQRFAMKSMSVRIVQRLATNPKDYFSALCEALPIHPAAARESLVWYYFWMRSLSDPMIREAQAAEHAAWLEQVKTCIAGLSRRSAYLSQQEMEDEAEELIAFINGIAIRAVLEPKAWPARRQITSLKRYLTRAGLDQKPSSRPLSSGRN
ncbi:TetR family transcriptional regulator [Mesorhizobium tianshanense]|uniref:TetR family transcriptional regulator n=1 Tax=Mesorhizobium tianshanense TaxID=39844 RepID=A0A562N440_9HYPH|nr:TetR family transcriptional regulator C-terminal domain-containing protein [Mesorhizobium tianshanense]TWI26858.1 TetR family transcriptional regulator [Mesorhizobium tianshanense]GLS40303.1 TetR family transcriptional regulator [Mesorhizobium tianshanense]